MVVELRMHNMQLSIIPFTLEGMLTRCMEMELHYFVQFGFTMMISEY